MITFILFLLVLIAGYVIWNLLKKLEKYDWTPMPSCMDDKYIISDDPIVNYRNYYINGKKEGMAFVYADYDYIVNFTPLKI